LERHIKNACSCVCGDNICNFGKAGIVFCSAGKNHVNRLERKIIKLNGKK
jgi:hypothetical protein